MNVQPQQCGFAAEVTGLELAAALTDAQVEQLKGAWRDYPVLYFPNQPLTHQQFERFTQVWGAFGHDPYVAPLPEHPHILEVRREAKEKAPPFGNSWHSDWSFQQSPPAATLLHAKVVPPVGGETWYADGYQAYDALSVAMQQRLQNLTAIHSARRPYSHQGFFAAQGAKRSMRIRPSDEALAEQHHPIVRTHPVSGRKALWVNSVYTVGIRDMPQREANSLLATLFEHLAQERFTFRHCWAVNMLTLWDNRCVQHCAQGGYDGYQRIMHRTTVAGDRPV